MSVDIERLRGFEVRLKVERKAAEVKSLKAVDVTSKFKPRRQLNCLCANAES